MVGRPTLTIEKTGPEKARMGAEVVYQIVIRNTGSAIARNVVITDTLPEGLKHASGNNNLTMNVGDLAPGASKAYQVRATAAKTGKVCNPAVAKAANAGEVKAEACTVIVEPKLEVEKAGPKDQIIGRTAEYTVVVSNPGTDPVSNVVVTDTAPTGTRIVSADGASLSGNTATWRIAELKAGAKQNYKITLTTATPGKHCNVVSASSAEGLTARAQSCTDWKGQAALLIEVVDNPDPIMIGETTTYTIRVTNQGTAPDSNVKISATFAKEIDPASAAGHTPGTVAAKTVTFAPVASLAAKQVVTWTITAKGAAIGDHRLKVMMNSDLLGTPVTVEESTHVY